MTTRQFVVATLLVCVFPLQAEAICWDEESCALHEEWDREREERRERMAIESQNQALREIAEEMRRAREDKWLEYRPPAPKSDAEIRYEALQNGVILD